MHPCIIHRLVHTIIHAFTHTHIRLRKSTKQLLYQSFASNNIDSFDSISSLFPGHEGRGGGLSFRRSVWVASIFAFLLPYTLLGVRSIFRSLSCLFCFRHSYWLFPGSSAGELKFAALTNLWARRAGQSPASPVTSPFSYVTSLSHVPPSSA